MPVKLPIGQLKPNHTHPLPLPRTPALIGTRPGPVSAGKPTDRPSTLPASLQTGSSPPAPGLRSKKRPTPPRQILLTGATADRTSATKPKCPAQPQPLQPGGVPIAAQQVPKRTPAQAGHPPPAAPKVDVNASRPSDPGGTVLKVAPLQKRKPPKQPQLRGFSASTQQLVKPQLGNQPVKQQCVLVSVDVEWWERDQTRVLELGWSCWDNSGREIVSRHWIVKEWLGTVNGRYVPNHKLEFEFGVSEVGSLSQGVAALSRDLSEAAATGCAPQPSPPHAPPQPASLPLRSAGPVTSPTPREQSRAASPSIAVGVDGVSGERPGTPANAGAAVGEAVFSSSSSSSSSSIFPVTDVSVVKPLPQSSDGKLDGGGRKGLSPLVVLVGHGMQHDVKIMKALGVLLPVGIVGADTQKLAMPVLRTKAVKTRKNQPIGLLALLRSLDMAPTKLHNAGNDALWTLRAALALLKA
ncbi:MAG: hypothetical protein WDW36_004967 [Sanguina aurantia]